ncbi:DUF1835 domain-containing protein [Lutibacter sp.]
MSNIIHILNNDAIAQILEKSEIKGDIIVWREMLCEGALHKNVGSDEFWKKRYTYFKNQFNVESIEYYDTTIREIKKVEDLSNYNEVVLWFECNLFQQINLLALCTFLVNNYVKKTNYFLVYFEKENGNEPEQPFTNLSTIDLKTIFENKTTLSKTSLLFAKESWKIYVENDIDKLKKFDFNKNSKFKCLQKSINQHLLRFPSEKGLNQIEYKILRIVNSGIFTEKQIIRTLLIWQQKETIYGFGELQYFNYLKQLKKYIEIKESKIYLNKKGREAIGV